MQPCCEHLKILQESLQYQDDNYASQGLTGQQYTVAAVVSLKYLLNHAEYFWIELTQIKTYTRNWKVKIFENTLDVLALALPRSDHSTKLVTLS